MVTECLTPAISFQLSSSGSGCKEDRALRDSPHAPAGLVSDRTGTFRRHKSLYAMPTRKSLIGARVPASAEFAAAFTNPKASRLVYRYSILPRIASVIAYSTPTPAVQPLDLPPVVTKGAAPVRAKAVEGLPAAHPPVPKTRKPSNA